MSLLVIMVNAKPFKLKGVLPLGKTYSGAGVNSRTGNPNFGYLILDAVSLYPASRGNAFAARCLQD
ncbi:MAG: hypothetical protein NT004_02485 [Bacteroidetes bacterium]|nr:hypothetical protein [Bacteroidota bacterium]